MTKNYFETKAFFRELLRDPKLLFRSEVHMNFFRVRDLRSRVTMLESLFTRLHDQKTGSYCIENFKILTWNLPLENNLRKYRHFKRYLPFQRRVQSFKSLTWSRQVQFSFSSHYALCVWKSKNLLTPKLISSSSRANRPLFSESLLIKHIHFHFELQRVYLNRYGTETYLQSLETRD